MARDRTSALRATTTTEALAPSPRAVGGPPVPPEVEEVVDLEREQRLQRITKLLACATPESTIFRVIQNEFGVPRRQAQADYADARDWARKILDSEGAIDATMLAAMTRLHDMAHRFYRLAMTEVPDRVLATPGPDPDNPEEHALYRPLTPGERASEVGARVAAAGTSIKANNALTSLAGRRSQRWADKPSTVIAIGSAEGLSAEDKELLRTLGMGA